MSLNIQKLCTLFGTLFLVFFFATQATLIPLAHAEDFHDLIDTHRLYFSPDLFPTFKDVKKTHSQFIPISYLASKQVIKGYTDGTFQPDHLVTRAEALKIIFSGLGIQIPTSLTKSIFNDIQPTDWVAPYATYAVQSHIIRGKSGDTFAPQRPVSRMEFVKILMLGAGMDDLTKWQGQPVYDDIPVGKWYTPYLNFAGHLGLIKKDSANQLHPNQQVTRGEAAHMLYIMSIISHDQDTDLLLAQAENLLSQIEVYLKDNHPSLAKATSSLAVDFAMRAMKNTPNAETTSIAKLAKSYDSLVDAFISINTRNKEQAISALKIAIQKTQEASELNKPAAPVFQYVGRQAQSLLDSISPPVAHTSSKQVLSTDNSEPKSTIQASAPQASNTVLLPEDDEPILIRTNQ